MDWADTNAISQLYLCWGAQAGLHYFYGIPKYPLPRKMFGVFPHHVLDPFNKLMRGFDDVFLAPHSRLSEVRRDDIEHIADLSILAEFDEAGVHIIASKDGRHTFVTGHPEYDPLSLKVNMSGTSPRGYLYTSQSIIFLATIRPSCHC